jgi:hypothetical protein
MPAVAIAPAACDEDEAPVAAAADSLAVVELDPEEWPEWPSSLSVLLLHAAVKLDVEFEHESPSVSLEPLAKLTGAHYWYESADVQQDVASYLGTYLVQVTITRVIGHLKDTSIAGEFLGHAQVAQAEDARTLSLHHREVGPVVRLLRVECRTELPAAGWV